MRYSSHLLIGVFAIAAMFSISSCGLFQRGGPTPTSTSKIISTNQVSTTTPAATSSSTITASPVPTVTPSPAPTRTATPVPALAPTSSINQQAQSDGSIQIQDHKNGYQITIPPDWNVIDLTSGNLDQILSGTADVNPQASQMIQTYKPLLLQGAGLLAIDTNTSDQKNSISPIILTIGQVSQYSASLPMNFIIEANLQSIQQALPKAQVLSSNVGENKNGIEIGVIDVVQPVNTSPGSASVYEKLVIFKVNQGLVTIVMVADQSMQTAIAPVMQAMIDSIDVLK